MNPEDSRAPRVLICDAIHEAGIEMLRQHAEVDVKLGISQKELGSIIGDYEAIVVRSTTQIGADVLELAVNLRVIGRAGAGLDNIDVLTAQEKEIEVVNSPNANTLAVAEHTMGLMIALARQLATADKTMKAGEWAKKKLMGIGLAGRTLGIVGFGRIGRQVAIRAQAFGMRVIVNQSRPTPELNLEAGVETVSLPELLQQADFVTLHVPSRPETINLINAETVQHMKPTAYLINTARGGVVNEADLLGAIDSGQIAGAALDVFETEPATNSELALHAKVIATPHIAASTSDAQYNAAVTVAQKINDILESVDVENILPLKVVAMSDIFPHESIDQKRVDRLKGRLDGEGLLVNPPIVTEVEGRYMVLDGATRTAALKQMGVPHTVVQISTPESGLDLHTWYHVIQKITPKALFELLEELPDISLVKVDAEKADDNMFAYGALCYVQLANNDTYLIQPHVGINRLDALNKLTETYIGHSYVDRTLEKEMGVLRYEYPELTALVVFPEYTISQVMQVTLSGRYFPAGITRFIIPDRILRINADLNYLRDESVSLREKNKWLNDILQQKVQNNHIRFYREPVYLLDE